MRFAAHTRQKQYTNTHQILVHKFKYKHDDNTGDEEGESRAVILGVSNNGKYRLWGPCYQGSLATTYYNWITLEEVFFQRGSSPLGYARSWQETLSSRADW
jgi:hypothetical protein